MSPYINASILVTMLLALPTELVRLGGIPYFFVSVLRCMFMSMVGR